MGGLQARTVFHRAPLSLYQMPGVLHGGRAVQVPGDANNAAGGRMGAGAAARAVADQGRAGDHRHPLGHRPSNPQGDDGGGIGEPCGGTAQGEI